MVVKHLWLLLITVALWGQQPDWVRNIRNKPFIDVREYGARGDDSADDTTAIQAAIDACANVTTGAGPGEVRFPGGSYRLSSTITWKNCSLTGIFPSRTVFYWDGATNDIAIEKNVGSGLPFENAVVMSGFLLHPGKTIPNTWVRFYGDEYVDKFTRLTEVFFEGANSDAIVMDSTYFANIHWNNLRFDSIDGFAIRVNINFASNGNSFNLDNFTYDNNGSSTGGSGVFAFDNVDDTTFALLANVSNGRIETNVDFDPLGNKAVFNFLTSGSTKANCTFMALSMANVYYQNVASGAGHSLFYHDTGCTGGTAATPIMLRNSRAEGIASIFSGLNYNWNSVFPTSGTSSFADVVFGGWQSLRSQETEFVGYESTYKALSVRGRLDAGARFWVSADGKLDWADGAGGAVDTTLSRTAAGLLGVTLGTLYFPTITGSSQDGGVVTLQQNGLYFQRSTDDHHAESGGLYLGIGDGDPERGCIGAGAVTDCGTFTPIAAQSSAIRFNPLDHATNGANVEILVDDGLTPNTGAYDVKLTYTPTPMFRAQSLSGVRTLEMGSDIDTIPRIQLNATGVTIVGHAYASLGTPAAGTMVYCTDCTVATPCKDGGTGAWAFRTAAPAWNCPF